MPRPSVERCPSLPADLVSGRTKCPHMIGKKNCRAWADELAPGFYRCDNGHQFTLRSDPLPNLDPPAPQPDTEPRVHKDPHDTEEAWREAMRKPWKKWQQPLYEDLMDRPAGVTGGEAVIFFEKLHHEYTIRPLLSAMKTAERVTATAWRRRNWRSGFEIVYVASDRYCRNRRLYGDRAEGERLHGEWGEGCREVRRQKKERGEL